MSDHILWSQNEATDHLFISDGIFLTGLRLSYNLGIAHGILGNSFALSGNLICFNHVSNFFVMSVDAIGIASKTVLNFLVTELFDHVTGINGLSGAVDIVVTASD